MALDYFYDGQIRRYKEQFGRIFSTFQCYSGNTADGTAIYKTVPCIPAPTDMQVMNIISNNSENVITVLPMFAYYITDMKPAPTRRQNPHYVRQLNVAYRKIDPVTKEYTSEMGNEYLVESYMPVPYDVTFRLDLWYSNDLNKEELAEQIQGLFNPMIDIQTNRNELDWSSLTVVELVDILWNPISYGSNMDITKRIMSFVFRVPIWINPPSKVKKSNKINEIIISVNQGSKSNIEDGDATGSLLSRTVVTPGNFDIIIKRVYDKFYHYKVKLNVDKNNPTDETGAAWTWPTLIQRYGQFNDDSELLLLTNIWDLSHNTEYNDSSTDDNSKTQIIAGTIAIDEDDETLMDFYVNPDTLPQYFNNTIYIDAVIDPSKSVPFGNTSGSCAKKGMTYLILNTIPQGSKLWGTVYENNSPISSIDAAVQYDILQFDGTRWNKIFNSVTNKNSIAFASSTCNGDPLTFKNGVWSLTVDGEYDRGYWRLRL